MNKYNLNRGSGVSIMKGFSIIEVLIALFIFSTAMLGAGITILQSLKFTRESLYYTQKMIQAESDNEKISQ